MVKTTTLEHVELGPVMQKEGRNVLVVEALDTKVQRQLNTLEKQLYVQVQSMGQAALGIGRTLQEIHDLLEPQGLFVYYLNRLEWISQATAYRYMAAYKRVQDNLPVAVVERAITSGIRLFGLQEDRPFGRYTEIVQAMSPPPKDAQGADAWIAELQAKAKEAAKRKPRTPEAESPPEPDSADPHGLARLLVMAYKATDQSTTFDAWLSGVVMLAKQLWQLETPAPAAPVKRRAAHA